MIGYGGIRCWGKLDAMDQDEYEEESTKTYHGGRSSTQSQMMADTVYIPDFLVNLLFPPIPEINANNELRPQDTQESIPQAPPPVLTQRERTKIQHNLGLLEPSAGGHGHEGDHLQAIWVA